MKNTHIMVAVAVVTCLGSFASAGVVNVSQTRAVQARVSFEDTIDDSTNNVGPWTRSITQTGTFLGGQSTATQSSNVSDTRFAGRGTIAASDGMQTVSASARTSYTVTFDVTVPTEYSLLGRWNVSFENWSQPSAGLHFERLFPNPTTLHNSFFDYNGDDVLVTSGSANLAGMLPVGRYRLDVYVDQSNVVQVPGFTFAEGSFDFDLIVPSPGSIAIIGLAGLVAARRRR